MKKYKYSCKNIKIGINKYIIMSLMSLFYNGKRSWGSFVECSTPDLNMWPE